MAILKISDKLMSEKDLRIPEGILLREATSPAKACPGCGSGEFDGITCNTCKNSFPPFEFLHPKDQRKALGKDPLSIGRDPGLRVVPWVNPADRVTKKKKKKKKTRTKTKQTVEASLWGKDNLQEVEEAAPTRLHDAYQMVLQMDDQLQDGKQIQGARMSRFDDELTKQAAVPGIQYNQEQNMYLDGPFGLSSVTPAQEVTPWKNIYPDRWLNVQDLDASVQDVIGGPVWETGSPYVHVKEDVRMPGQQVAPQLQGIPAQPFVPGGIHQYNQPENLAPVKSSVQYDGVEEDLYKAYEASRDLRMALKEDDYVDFTELNSRLATVLLSFQEQKTASRQETGTTKYLIKFASEICDSFEYGEMTAKQARKSLKQLEELLSNMSKIGTNGNQETGIMTDVRDLDDSQGIWDRGRVMTPDYQTQVVVPNLQPNQLALADTPDDYNDGSETGFGAATNNFHREPWPYDATNPALVGDMAAQLQAQAQGQQMQMAASVQAAKEKILDAIEVVDRLERLGMVESKDKANHIAKFEQMSDAKLAGFKASLDMLEESGARQPRSQKVATVNNNNRMPEMGRLTTASTTNRQQISADDWLMTL